MLIKYSQNNIFYKIMTFDAAIWIIWNSDILMIIFSIYLYAISLTVMKMQPLFLQKLPHYSVMIRIFMHTPVNSWAKWNPRIPRVKSRDNVARVPLGCLVYETEPYFSLLGRILIFFQKKSKIDLIMGCTVWFRKINILKVLRKHYLAISLEESLDSRKNSVHAPFPKQNISHP